MDKVKYGLCNVHVAKMSVKEDGTITYDKPFAIPGAVNLSFDADGDSEPFYADNIKYFESFANNGYSGELEIAKIPDIFYKEILGQKIDKNGGLLENINDQNNPFAFMYQIQGDTSETRFVYYNSTVSRPSSEAKTVENTKKPDTDTLKITTASRKSDGNVRYKLPKTSANAEVYEKFFDSVCEPAEETPAVQNKNGHP